MTLQQDTEFDKMQRPLICQFLKWFEIWQIQFVMLSTVSVICSPLWEIFLLVREYMYFSIAVDFFGQ